MITTKGWEGICEAPEPVPLGIVREFYANAKAEKKRLFRCSRFYSGLYAGGYFSGSWVTEDDTG
jgi:hypothetical protein